MVEAPRGSLHLLEQPSSHLGKEAQQKAEQEGEPRKHIRQRPYPGVLLALWVGQSFVSAPILCIIAHLACLPIPAPS